MNRSDGYDSNRIKTIEYKLQFYAHFILNCEYYLYEGTL